MPGLAMCPHLFDRSDKMAFRPLATICIAFAICIPARADQECGTILTPAEAQALSAIDQALAPVADPRGPPLYYVPLAFHVVRRTNGTGGLTPTQVCQGLDLLDESYIAMNIQFYLVGAIDYINNDNYYNSTNTLAEINSLRQINLVPDAINIYFVPNLAYESGGLCGISAFTTSSIQSIAMNNSCMPTSNYSTLPHEVGHYLNLYHTHETAFGAELVNGSNCVPAGDKVCDTPADPVLGTSTVSAFPACAYTGSAVDSNGDPYAPNAKNFMSYSRKECRDHFSDGQNSRAYTTLVTLRPELAHESLPGEADCNGNSIRDGCDIAQGTATDCDVNGLPDNCQPDCDSDGKIDACDVAGDVDENLAVNQVDVDLFVDVLLGTNINPLHVAQCDLDCNGVRDGRDVAGLVGAMLGP
jgi:hypothetical protein